MSRELKFRAWDTYDKTWVHFLKIKSTGKIVDFDIDDEGYHEFTAPEGRYILESYTGLKDKNGEEIYEGDIMKLNVGYLSEVGVVEFYAIPNDGAAFLIDRAYDIDTSRWRVIGNIHENPELLKKEGK